MKGAMSPRRKTSEMSRLFVPGRSAPTARLLWIGEEAAKR